MDKKLSELIKYTPATGANALNASQDNPSQWSVGEYTGEVDALLASLASGSPDVLAARQQFGAAIAEPIMQIVPYVEQFDRFFMQQTIGELEDNLIAVEDLTNVAYSSHPRAEILYNEPGYYFTRPTFSTYQTGFKIAWPVLRKAGWNILARQMNFVAWEMARKRDAAAKVVIDAAVPTSHKLNVSGNVLTKAGVDEVIRSAAQIGFPVKNALINPGRLMQMQQWTFTSGVLFDPGLSKQLIDNLFYSNYGGVNWYAHPYAPVDTVYFFSDPSQIGWHQRKGSPRTDTFVDITRGEDQYALRDAEHAWYVGAGLGLWWITIAS
jgi:hypothetical protein